MRSRIVLSPHMGTKRMRSGANEGTRTAKGNSDDLQIVPQQPKGRTWTLSIALPSSILQNAQSPELQMYLAGQVARAAAIFCVDEIVVFTELETSPPHEAQHKANMSKTDDIAEHFVTILKYMETPQYLRKHLFPRSNQLRLVGLLNPLAIPSHLAKNEHSRWREGVAVGRHGQVRHTYRRPFDDDASHNNRNAQSNTKYVDVGQKKLVEVEQYVQTGQRVTIDLSKSGNDYERCPGKYLFGSIVDKRKPRSTDGIYWGYDVRQARSLAGVFSNSAVCNGYDLVVGTSEHGSPLGTDQRSSDFALPAFSHVLLVFGGVQGLEHSAICDHTLRSIGIAQDENRAGSAASNAEQPPHNVCDLFDFYVNTCSAQGSRTIRTEEAILISLAAIKPYLRPKQ